MNRFFYRMTLSALTVVALFVCAGSAQATDLSGSHSSVTIHDDSRLTGDVTCTAPLVSCIVFGASHIKLSLNGHTITGPVDPLTNLASCSHPGDSTFGVGIEATDVNDIKIEGPGVIQHFQRWGILLDSFNLATVTDIHVTKVTATRNCWSGMQTIGVSDSHFEENVWANNAVGSNGAACGGICLVSSNKNKVHKSTFYGNGTAAFGSVAFGNVDFGVGLEGTSSGNRIEENQMGGNTNGVLVFSAAHDNVIRHNIIVGNPPAQVSVTFPTATGAGADIHDRHASAGANTFEDNLCLTYLGPGTPPCPNIRKEADEARNRLTSPPDSQKDSSGASTRRVQTSFAIASLLAITFGRFVGSVLGL
jgi:parallel beta-helix repeat protein